MSRMLTCSKDFYLEPVSGTCKPCDELCHQATARGTIKLCRRYCPVGVETPVTEVPINQVTDLVTSDYELSTISLSSDSSLEAQYGVIFLTVLIIVISLMAIIVLLKRPIKHFLNERNTKKRNLKDHGLLPVYETHHETPHPRPLTTACCKWSALNHPGIGIISIISCRWYETSRKANHLTRPLFTGNQPTLTNIPTATPATTPRSREPSYLH